MISLARIRCSCPNTTEFKNPTTFPILIKTLLLATAVTVFSAQCALAANATVTLPQPQTDFEAMTFVNYETPHVRPMAMTPDQQLLLVVNTVSNQLMVFDVSSGRPVQIDSIPVGVEPVSVNARTNNEVWVVNQLSDSVSVVDLSRGTVIDTLKTLDEPADVVFAGAPQRAFVTASQVNRISVFNPDNRQATPEEITLIGEDPRMMAVSPDGLTVYAAIFESGNATTIMAGGKNFGIENETADGELYTPRILDEVEDQLGPYGGNEQIPNDDNGYNPPINLNNPNPPPVSIIVKKHDDGLRQSDSVTWQDDNGKDWSGYIDGTFANGSTVPLSLRNRVTGWDLPDNDVAIINTNTLAVQYQSGLMNMVMAVAVNPRTGMVTVVGTEATNEVRFEPVINGTFVRVKYASFDDATNANERKPQLVDLNSHLDYRSSTAPQSVRDMSIGDPRGIVWRNDGRTALVTGMGSNNVFVINQTGSVIDRIEVQQGPTGVVINELQNKAYVLNRFDASVSVINLQNNQVIQSVGYFDPTPNAIIAGRPFLYDTHATSGLGQASCASCHVDARTDRLAWDLGNPAGSMDTRIASVIIPSFGGEETIEEMEVSFHPMKGPMKTQTLQDIIGSPALHHRGDKDDIFGFADAFKNLQGDDLRGSDATMSALEAYLDTIHYPPNPNRNIDNSLSTSVKFQGPSSSTQTDREGNGSQGNAAAGLKDMLDNPKFSCIRCHKGERGRSGLVKDVDSWHVDQIMIAEPIGGFYDRMGMFWNSARGSTSGFGFRTDASQDSRFLHEGTTNDALAVFLSWDGPKSGIDGLSRDSHAGVGQQVQLSSSTDQKARELVGIADSGNIGLVAHGSFNGNRQGFAYTGSNSFQSDKLGVIVSYNDLLMAAGSGDELVFSLVARGTEYRLALDTDLDGILNRDDASPLNTSLENWIDCGAEGAQCDVDGTSVVRYGTSGQWLYGVFTSSVDCSNEQFGDPAVGEAKSCQYLPGINEVEIVPPANAVECASEWVVCSLPSGVTATVWYGVDESWVTKDDQRESVSCNNSVFTDPRPNKAKSCWYVVTDTDTVDNVPPSSAVECANEWGICDLPSGVTTTVWYGVDDSWIFKENLTGAVVCNNSFFTDPRPNKAKSCRYEIFD